MKIEGKILAEQIDITSKQIQIPEIENLMFERLGNYPGDRQTQIGEFQIDLFANFNCKEKKSNKSEISQKLSKKADQNNFTQNSYNSQSNFQPGINEIHIKYN